MGFKRFDIAGEKVRLRPMKAGDADVIFDLVRNDNILKWLIWDGPDNIDELKNYYRDRTRDFRFGNEYFSMQHLISESPWDA